MSKQAISKLTPEQEALIPIYREKWKAIATSTQRIDRTLATEAINSLYAAIGRSQPQIYFFDSPYGALKAILWGKIKSNSHLKKDARKPFRKNFQLSRTIWQQLSKPLWDFQQNYRQNWWQQKTLNFSNQFRINSFINYSIKTNLKYLFYRPLKYELQKELIGQIKNCIDNEYWISNICLFDYLDTVLKISLEHYQWQALKAICENCGWIFPHESICLVCDRPTKLSLDNQDRLHAEAEAAIEFADSYKLYSYHGVILPEKYGFFPHSQWQSQWLLQEENAEIRRILIQAIGYERICQELQATDLDSWREYTLLQIDNHIDTEPIFLLKMTCPSTKFIHTIRVPPKMRSAREAICWANWGIDPEEFSTQT